MLSNFNEPIVRWLNEQAEQGIFLTDTAFRILSWNRWMEEHSGLTAAQVAGRQLFDTFPELRDRRLDDLYSGALEGQTQIVSNRLHRYFLRMPAQDEGQGGIMQQSARIAPLLSDEQVIGTITVIEDVTERVAYVEELRRARDEAEASTRAKDQFIAILSHDLRTPLTGLIGWAQVLKTSKLDLARTDRAIEAILRNASVQLQMIDDLLDVSRITSGKLRLEFESADLLELVQAAVESLRPSIESKGIRFVQILPVTHRMASVDPKRMKQVIWNLLSNAQKFTPAGGIIELELEFRDDCAELRIKDTGAGISKEALPRIFEPMWQAHEDGKVPGLGLGLSIVYHVVSSHGGSVQAESQGVDQGAQFIVQLPWNHPEVAAGMAQRSPRAASDR